jgi:hypothetical protein
MRPTLLAAALIGAALVATVPAAAQSPRTLPTPPAEAAQPVPTLQPGQRIQILEDNAHETRNQLQEILNAYPENLRRVLQWDPTLLNEQYLAPYPRLALFVQQHPEIERNPAFFLGTAREDYWNRPQRDIETFAMILAGIGLFIGVMTVLTLIASLVRQLIDYRRWLRQSRIQTEMHTKVFDRLTSNQELLAYIESPAGRRFLDGSPLSHQSMPSSAPVSRILWSVQVGVVLATLGLGLWIVNQNMNLPAEALPAFYVLSVVAIALGVGAMISSIVAYLLSARLGLLAPHSHSSSNA